MSRNSWLLLFLSILARLSTSFMTSGGRETVIVCVVLPNKITS